MRKVRFPDKCLPFITDWLVHRVIAHEKALPTAFTGTMTGLGMLSKGI